MLLERHFQNAYVTADLDRALPQVTERFAPHVEPVRFTVTQTMWTRGGEGEAVLKLGFVQVGALQIELIEPVSGPVGLYREVVPSDMLLRQHHVGMRADDLNAVLAMGEALGLPLVLSGESNGIRFIYLDARTTFGHYLEYICAPNAYWDAMQSPS